MAEAATLAKTRTKGEAEENTPTQTVLTQRLVSHDKVDA